MSARKRGGSWFRRLGPGLITGAADDDPSGIATYSQAGAQFGVNMLWTVVLTYPLMVGDPVDLRPHRPRHRRGPGRQHGARLPAPAGRMSSCCCCSSPTPSTSAPTSPPWARRRSWCSAGARRCSRSCFALGSLGLQIFVPYHRYVHVLKWLTLALFAYVGVMFTVQIDWGAVALGALWPQIAWTPDDAHDGRGRGVRHDHQPLPVLLAKRGGGRGREIDRRRTAARAPATRRRRELRPHPHRHLCRHGVLQPHRLLHHPDDGRDAARGGHHRHPDLGRRPPRRCGRSPGEFAFLLFSLGIIGTGLLALPVLAGSAAYAIGELRGWRIGLEQKPWETPKASTRVIALATRLGLLHAVPAARSDQGAVLERGAQRRHRRADDGGDDARRLQPCASGPFVAPVP